MSQEHNLTLGLPQEDSADVRLVKYSLHEQLLMIIRSKVNVLLVVAPDIIHCNHSFWAYLHQHDYSSHDAHQ